jgi:prepilin-type N-terminal cleavage/methylation domain-containing protein
VRVNAKSARGFTLIEMMVVLTVGLSMIICIAMIFRLSTRTVQTVERKLAVYEAARNILDIIHNQLLTAVSNERGEQFSIKSAYFIDSDPFTPVNPDPNARYGHTSRREADAVNFRVINAGANVYRDAAYIPGSYVFPISYQGLYYTFPECYKFSLRSSLLYPKLDDWDASSQYQVNQNSGYFFQTPSQIRTDQMNDVSQIELTGVLVSTNNEASEAWNGSNWWNYILTPKDMAPNFFAPGNEPKLSVPMGSDVDRKNQARLSGFHIMDLDIAYWDETAKHFVDPPDNSVIYFNPPPKAARITITVCDVEKRSSVTLRRVVQLITGTNPSSSSNAKPWIVADDNNYTVPLPVNQPKSLKQLQKVGIEPVLDLP